MYQLFQSQDEALAYSEQAGIDAGLAYHTGDPNGTRYLYFVISHPDGRAACFVDGATEGLTHEELEADGWFPELEDIEP